jgi:hypothetical protein
MGFEPWISTMESKEFYKNDKIENTFVLPWSSSAELGDASFVVNSFMDILTNLQISRTDVFDSKIINLGTKFHMGFIHYHYKDISSSDIGCIPSIFIQN